MKKIAVNLLIIACATTLASCAGKKKTTKTTRSYAAEEVITTTPTINNNTLHFEFDRPRVGSVEGIVAADEYIVNEVADAIKAGTNMTIMLEGHCDTRGTSEYNLALGARRSNAVKSRLTGLGISGAQIETTSYGKERPAVENANTEEAHAQNRRVVVVPR